MTRKSLYVFSTGAAILGLTTQYLSATTELLSWVVWVLVVHWSGECNTCAYGGKAVHCQPLRDLLCAPPPAPPLPLTCRTTFQTSNTMN